jgi:hypothetical protein
MIDRRNVSGSASLQDAIGALLLGCLLGVALVAWLLLGERSPYNAPQPGFARGFGLGCLIALFMGFAVYFVVTGVGTLVRWWQRRADGPAH